MVSTTEGFNEKSPMLSVPYVTVKKPNSRKPLRQFSETLDNKPNTAVHRLCTAK